MGIIFWIYVIAHPRTRVLYEFCTVFVKINMKSIKLPGLSPGLCPDYWDPSWHFPVPWGRGAASPFQETGHVVHVTLA